MRARQRGAALVCALVIMLVTMLLGVSICNAVFASIASAGAERERSLALEAAEAGLRDAERDIAASAVGADPARAARFTAAGAGGFVDACGRGGTARGLCSATSPPAWQGLDLAEVGHPALVPYGYFTGAAFGVGKGLLPAHPPAYLIEKIAPPGAGESLGSFYRITAIGFGSIETSRVVLQSVYRKPKPAPPDPPAPDPPAPGAQAAPSPAQLPAGRIGWREIANWSRLHAEAVK